MQRPVAAALGALVITAGMAPLLQAQPANPVLAVGDRIADGAPTGLKGVIIKIGGPGDPYYYQGCYAIHFDYEQADPGRVQWTCTNTGSKIFKLDAANSAVAAAPLAANPMPLPAQQPLPAEPAAPLPAQQPLPADSVLPAAAPAMQAGLANAPVQSGRYECYGAVGAMGGFNFAITGPGAYTDVQGKPGTYTMAGAMMTFHGSAHDGERATFFAGPDVRHPSHITFENTLGGGLGISCDKVS